MKKKVFAAALSAVCTAALAMTGTGLSASAEAAPGKVRIMGDLDGDLCVSAGDAQATLNLYVDSLIGKASADADMENGTADIDMDGKITAADAQSILNYYCRTLVGGQPLWAEYREQSYVGQEDQNETGKYIEDAEGNLILNPAYEKQQALFGKSCMYLEVGCASGAPGEQVSVPIYVSGASHLAGFQFYLNNSSAIRIDSIDTDNVYLYDQEDPLWGTETTEDGERGILVWVNAGGRNVEVTDGTIIGYYNYIIPEDAESGSFIPLTIDEQNSIFVLSTPNQLKTVNGPSMCYNFTLLNGVIAVK